VWRSVLVHCTDRGDHFSLFLGAVTTVQTAYQLVSPLVQPSTIAQIVRDSMILELSPTVVSIVLAGVVGSKIASELGNMRISEQIDALEIMGINTKSYLIMPKILAALVVIPCLIVISAVLGIWGDEQPVLYRVFWLQIFLISALGRT
jgi:phospholipid/cholesterol/gamma-HCH transport system permease protein